jgi:hypothetical protein
MAYVAASTAAGMVIGFLDDGPGVNVPRDVVIATGLFGLFFAGVCVKSWLALA